MAGFVSRDDLINEMTVNGKLLELMGFKVGPTAEGAGVWSRLWAANGLPGNAGEPATTPGTAYTNAAGSINWANQSPDQKYLLTFGGLSTQDTCLMVYDRLVGVSGINIAAVSPNATHTINSTALPRYSGAASVGVQAWLEITTGVTAGTPVVRLDSYTNSDGTAGRLGTNLTLATTPAIQSMYQLPLQAGDLGVRSVESINVSVLGTSGVANLVLLKPLAVIPLVANQWNECDFVDRLHALPRIYDGASLAFAFLASVATAPTIFFHVRAGYG